MTFVLRLMFVVFLFTLLTLVLRTLFVRTSARLLFACTLCRAPLLPLLTRDVKESGLVCVHCSETLIPFEEIPEDVRPALQAWADEYAPVHGVAHWDERRQKATPNYDRAYEEAAQQAERLLARGGLFFCRLASAIGFETRVKPLGDAHPSGKAGWIGRGRYRVPDGTIRYLVDEAFLIDRTRALGGQLLDPIKTTVVQDQRSMTTWVIRKT